MIFSPPLIPATLLKRYKRFLADVTLPDGTEVTAHCPNPGSMLGLKDAGLRVWLQPNDDPKRKLRYGWKLVELPGGTFVGIDTNSANRIIRAALDAKKIPELAAYSLIKPEVKYGENSRIDFLLQEKNLPDCYLEVKSVTLSRHPGLAEFPDSVTKRGAKHLAELSTMVAQGHRAIMLYLVQRSDCTHLSLADDLDPTYSAAYSAARKAGVEVLCFDTNISPSGISISRNLPCDI